MPIRKIPLATGEIYHILNRGINHQPIFQGKRDYKRALETFSYYMFSKIPLRFSYWIRLDNNDKNQVFGRISENSKLVSVLSFCFMPNHFHFLLRQEEDFGISKFLAKFQNSFTRYFNERHERTGHLFQGQFKAVRIENENQLLHTSRYIHLNPYSGYIVKTIDELREYPWSSFREYIEGMDAVSETKTILSGFASKEKYFQFVNDQKDYQRTLNQIKHLLIE